MKTTLGRLCLSLGLLILTGLCTGRAAAQIAYTNLHNFTPLTGDGASPVGTFAQSGGTLYGATGAGGNNGGISSGTLYSINLDGSNYQVIYNFTPISIPGGGGGGIPIGGGGGIPSLRRTNGVVAKDGGVIGLGGSPGTNEDGADPNGGLVLSGSTLYGTAINGGTNGYGTVFAVQTDGSDFMVLHDFSAPPDFLTNVDGINPDAALILSGTTLYGTTREGGALGYGTVFSVNTDGTDFTVLYNFDEVGFNTLTFAYFNTDGSQPETHLALAGNTLYGTTSYGGLNGGGSVFSLQTDGSNFQDLHDFSAYVDGEYANSLIVANGKLYGSTSQGGPYYAGTLFSLNTDGSDFTNLYVFSYNTPGYEPYADLILSSNILYGATGSDPNDYAGTVFELYADGTSYTTLYTFSQENFNYETNVDGVEPNDLILSTNVLYGVASGGGFAGHGTAFSLSQFGPPPPQLNLTVTGANLTFTWSADAPAFSLQSTPNLNPPVVWSPVVASPVVVNGQNTVTIPTSGDQYLYRLSQ